MTKTGFALIAAAFLGILGYAGYYARSYFWSLFRSRPGASLSPETALLIPALIVVGVLILVLVGLVVAIFRSARREGAEDAAPGKAPDAPPVAPVSPPPAQPADTRSRYSAGALKTSFVRAEKWLRGRVTGADFRYRIPWIPMIGPPGSGKTTGLGRCGLHLPSGPPFAGVETARAPLNWWFFERGAVLDLAGDLVVRPDRPDADPAPSDQRLWRRFLRLLQRYRPRKPMDGVVLTLPCGDLLDAAGSGDANLLVQTAEALYRRLWRLQRDTGIRFPVYLLVTRCETLEGFAEFQGALPEDLSRQMFGWSSDQPPGGAVTESWIREAFDSVSRELTRVQFELLTQGVRPESRDGVFQFPQSLRRLESPLRTALDRVFRQSAYHESFALRGIYFTGGEGRFLRDLLDRKVFPEAGLARPLRGTLVSRNRRVLAVQTAAALLALTLGVGLWWNGRQLREDVRQTAPTIAQINTDVREMKAKRLEGLTGIAFFSLLRNEEPFFRESVINLIQGLSDVRSLSYPFIPPSWFSPVHDRIRRAMTLAYDEIILKGVYVFLVQRTESLFRDLQTAIRAAPPPGGTVIPVDEAPEFVALRRFVDRIKVHEGFVGQYNDLRETESMQGLGQIIEYLFDIRLPASFFEGDQYYYRALEESRYREFDIRAYRLKARQVRVDGFIERMFVNNPARLALRDLRGALADFGERDRTDPRLSAIRDLLARMAAAQAVIRRPELAWVFNERFDLGPEFNQLLHDAENLRFFGGDLRARLEGELEAAFRGLRDDLHVLSSDLTGPLLKRSETGAELLPALSEPTLAFQAELEKLADQAFMAREEGGGDVLVPPGMRIRWEPAPLREAVDLVSPYQRFARVDLPAFPAALQNTVGDVARRNLERHLLERIRRAMSFEPMGVDRTGRVRERDVAEEIENFRAAAPLLTRTLTYADRLGLRDVETVLSEVCFHQVTRLLAAVDAFLAADDLYAVRGGDFSWWDGEAPVALAAFGAADETELDHYLRIQRERVRHLAFDCAEPLVAFAAGSGVLANRREEGLLLRWERILAALEQYEARNPENPVTALERFVRHRMDEITPTRFFREVGADELNARSGDFFLARRNRLRRLLVERCRTLSREHLRVAWAAIRDRFDRLLAGRYPFVPVGQPLGVEVEPAALRNFFRSFRRDAGPLRDLLAALPEPGPEERNVLDFLDRMAEVQRFFGPFLEEPVPAAPPAPEAEASPKTGEGESAAVGAASPGDAVPDVPAFDLEVFFRVNSEREVLANRIIEWTFSAGRQRAVLGGENRGARWVYGEPVRLRLRWARNGLDVPVWAGPDAAVNPETRAVEFVHENRWSLLRLLQTHRAGPADFPGRRDPRPHTLRFRVDTERIGEESAEPLPPTRLYLRLVLSTPERNGRTVVLPDFPAAAPALSGPAVEFGRAAAPNLERVHEP